MKRAIINIRLISLFIVALAAAIFLVVMMLYGRQWYPMGWDAGYYMAHTKEILGGQVSLFSPNLLRSGYMVFSAAVVSVTHISLRSAEILIPIALLIMLASLAGIIVTQVSGRWSLGVLAGILHLFNPGLLRMTQSLSANLLALTLLYGLVLAILLFYRKPKILLPAMCGLLFLIATVHIETLFFTLLLFFTSGGLLCALKPAGTQRRLSALYFLVLPVVAGIAALFAAPGHASISGLLDSYLRTLGFLSNGSGSVTDHAWIEGLTAQLRFSPYDLLAVLGMIALFSLLYVKKRSTWSLLLGSWMLVSMAILGVSIGQESFVFQRTKLLWPHAMLAVFGYEVVRRVIHNRNVRRLIFIIVLVSSITTGVLYVRNNQAWFPITAVRQLDELVTLLPPKTENTEWDMIVVLPTDEEWSNIPHYMLRSDNIGAILPTAYTRTMCIFGLSFAEYLSFSSTYPPRDYFSVTPGGREPCTRNPSGNLILLREFYTAWEGLHSDIDSGRFEFFHRSENTIIGKTKPAF